jgi:hypothetical protein
VERWLAATGETAAALLAVAVEEATAAWDGAVGNLVSGEKG